MYTFITFFEQKVDIREETRENNRKFMPQTRLKPGGIPPRS